MNPNGLKISSWAFVLFAGTKLLTSCSPIEEKEKRPNIILILADDLGYMDIQEYANKTLGTEKDEMFYETPNLNQLINEGVAFTYAYANQLCSPTRASILTGKYAARLGFTTATPRTATYYNQNLSVPNGNYAHDVIDHHDNIDNEMAWLNGSSNTALPSGTAIDEGWDETTIAEALQDYHSAFIGKWHIGGHGAKGYSPADQGFDPISWFDAGGSSYFNWREGWNNRSKTPFPDIPQKELLMGNAGKATSADYLTDELTEQALSYLDKRSKIKESPFFLYFCHFAVHSPNQAKQEDIDYFKSKPELGWNGHDNPIYAGMVRSLDNSVGEIMKKLEETGLDENTLIIFMSDNGGIDSKIIPQGSVTNNFPLKGGKACLTEGGIRVPLVFYMKGKLEKGKWCNVAVDCNDIFPTIIEAAGYNAEYYYNKKDGIDGRSLMALLEDVDNSKESYTRNTRYWHYPFNVIYNNPFDGLALTPHSAIMEGDYKLIFDWHGRLKLFNVREDISESHNLTELMPEKTKELFGKLMDWLESNVNDSYLPKLNSNYFANDDKHQEEFINLVELYRNGGDLSEISN